MWGERICNSLIGILFGPIDLPILNKSIISDVSYGVDSVENFGQGQARCHIFSIPNSDLYFLEHCTFAC